MLTLCDSVRLPIWLPHVLLYGVLSIPNMPVEGWDIWVKIENNVAQKDIRLTSWFSWDRLTLLHFPSILHKVSSMCLFQYLHDQDLLTFEFTYCHSRRFKCCFHFSPKKSMFSSIFLIEVIFGCSVVLIKFFFHWRRNRCALLIIIFLESNFILIFFFCIVVLNWYIPLITFFLQSFFL